MDKKIVTPGVGRKLRFVAKIQWKNGANETIHSETPPNVNPVLPMFMSFKIKNGLERMIGLSEVRAMDLEAHEDRDMIIT